jgi:hypothetical protein
VNHFNVFSSADTPAAVVGVLRAVPGVSLEVVEGTPSDWRALKGRWRRGPRHRTFQVTFDPSYSAPESWSKQLPGMFRYFLGADLGPPPARDVPPRVRRRVVHERRHALTWALSPGTPWDETDLST